VLSRRRLPYESRNVPALDMHVQAKGGSMIELDGIVDSGATCTVLSLKVAEDLGLTDLREAPDANLAGGIHIPTWITDTPIRAQAHVPLFPGGPLEPWGPIFDLHPVFLQAGRPLWGQEDVYAAFRIIAERYVDPKVAPAYFELEYWTDMFHGAPRPTSDGG
jgi:hypothetical protein